MLLATAVQAPRMELTPIVQVQQARQPVHRPGQIQAAVSEPLGFRQHALRKSERDTGRRRRIERHQEAQHTAGMHVQGRPRTARARSSTSCMPTFV
jgi:hypothetical protein